MFAVIYDRASDSKQKDNDSREHAKNELPKLAEKLGYKWELRQEVKSGKFLANRPVLKQIKEEIETGKINALVLQHIDRLGRFKKEKDRGIIVDAIIENEIPIITPDKVWRIWIREDYLSAVSIQLGIVATQENEDKVRRVSNAMIQKAKKGKYNGGKVVLGYDLVYTVVNNEPIGDLVINQDEKLTIECLFKTYTELQSASKTAKKLNELGYRKPVKNEVDQKLVGASERTFTTRHVLKAIENPLYAGLVEWGVNATNRYTKDYESEQIYRPELQIIDIATWERANNILSNRRVKSPHSGKWSRKPFSGFVLCPICHNPLKGSSSKNYSFYRCLGVVSGYTCPEPKTISENIFCKTLIPLMAQLIKDTIDFDKDMTNAAKGLEKDSVDLSLQQNNEVELFEIKEQRKRLVKAIATGILSDSEAKIEMDELREREQLLNRELQTIQNKTELHKSYLDAIEQLKTNDVEARLWRMFEIKPVQFALLLELIFERESIVIHSEGNSNKRVGIIDSYKLTNDFEKRLLSNVKTGRLVYTNYSMIIDLSQLLDFSQVTV